MGINVRGIRDLRLLKLLCTSPPDRPGHFKSHLHFSGKHSAMLQLLRKDYSITSPPQSAARYSFIQLSKLWDERNCQSFDTAGGGFEPGFPQLTVRHSNCYATTPHIVLQKTRMMMVMFWRILLTPIRLTPSAVV